MQINCTSSHNDIIFPFQSEDDTNPEPSSATRRRNALARALVSEDVDELSVPKVCRIIGRLATTTSASLSRARMMPILNLPVQREGRTRLLVPYLVLRTPKSISSPRRGDRPVDCLWSSHHNWKVLSVPVHPTKHLLHPLKRSRLHPPMVLRRILPRRNVISKVRHL